MVKDGLNEAGPLAALALSGALASQPQANDAAKSPKQVTQRSKESSHKAFRNIIVRAAKAHGVSPALIDAVIRAETGYRLGSSSSAGAQGLMQLMPSTAKSLGVDDVHDPEQNIMGGALYLKKMLDMFDGDVKLALAAYNAGPTNVRRYGGVPPFRETLAYIDRVLKGIETSSFDDT